MYVTLCYETTAKVDILDLLRGNVLSLSQLKDILLPAMCDEWLNKHEEQNILLVNIPEKVKAKLIHSRHQKYRVNLTFCPGINQQTFQTKNGKYHTPIAIINDSTCRWFWADHLATNTQYHQYVTSPLHQKSPVCNKSQLWTPTSFQNVMGSK